MLRHKRIGIQYRLLAAFCVVAATTVASAAVAWYTLSMSDRHVRQLSGNMLPALEEAEALASSAYRFTNLTKQIVRATNIKQLKTLKGPQKSHLDSMHLALDNLLNLGFNPKQINFLRKQAVRLGENLEVQYYFTSEAIMAKARVDKALFILQSLQSRFLKEAQSHIGLGYKAFVERGSQVGEKLRQVIMQRRAAADLASRRKLEEEVRVSIGTLVNIEVGEMRASMEMLAVANLLVGYYREAANVSHVEPVFKLMRRYEDQSKNIKRLEMILATSRPDSRQVLLKAKPLIAMGQGKDNIFHLKLEAIRKRTVAGSTAFLNQTSAMELSGAVNQLVADAQKASQATSQRLSSHWATARILQITAAVLAVLVAIFVGWLYVGRNITSRLGRLSRAMEEHAQGFDAPIPKGSDDEIGDMAHALESFVEQRNKAEYALVQSAERFQILAEILPYPVIIGDAEGVFIYISPKFTEIFGYTANEIPNRGSLNQKLNASNGQEIPDEAVKAGQALPGAAGTIQSELRLVCKDGSSKEVILHHIEMSDGGFYLVTQDVTEMRKEQERKLDREKISSVVETAGAVCHELNQPLQVIMARTEILMHKYREYKDIKRDLGSLANEYQRIADITRNLQNITQYRTKDYLDDIKILDIDQSASKTAKKKHGGNRE
jgi:PAS domain S-box-containing protein